MAQANPRPNDEQQSTRTLIAFLLMIVAAGANPIAIRLGGARLPPFWNATLRSGGGAIIFLILALLRRTVLPRGKALLGAVIYGLVSISAAFGFLYWGAQRVPASLTGSMLAFVPLLTVLFAAAYRLEPLRWQALAGTAVASVGVILGVSGGLSGRVPVAGLLALLGAAACLAGGGIVLKLFPRSDPFALNAVAFAAGTPALVALSRLSGEEWLIPAQTTARMAVAYQIVVGSVVVFYLYAYVLSRWNASRASLMFVLMPVVTVILASLVLGEVITLRFVTGAALVLAGVWAGVIRRAPKAGELVCTPGEGKVIC